MNDPFHSAAQQPQGRTAAAPLGAQPRAAGSEAEPAKPGQPARPAIEGLAKVALHQFHLRQRFAMRERRAGRIDADQASARLAPWVAAALRCGADPAQIHMHLAHDVQQFGAAVTADDLCPIAQVRETLTLARDKALDNLAEEQRAAGPQGRTPAAPLGAQPRAADAARPAIEGANTKSLMQMARHLGCPQYRPAAQMENV